MSMAICKAGMMQAAMVGEVRQAPPRLNQPHERNISRSAATISAPRLRRRTAALITLLAAEGVTGPGEGAIHVFLSSFDKRDVDGRDKPGHDGDNIWRCNLALVRRQQTP